MFLYSTQIFLHHTDAAGRLFFARQFDLVFEAKEKLLERLGFSVREILEHPGVSFPVVHAESDYKEVLQSGDRIVIHAGIEKTGTTSVIFSFLIFKNGGGLAGTAKTVNVCVCRLTGRKCQLPDDWRARFLGYSEKCQKLEVV